MTHWHNKPHKPLESIPVPVAAELLGPELVTLLLGLTPLLVCVAELLGAGVERLGGTLSTF